MRILLRILPFAILIWVICYFFYSLGKKRAFKEFKRYKKEGENAGSGRKVVESSVVEEETDADDSVHQK